MIGKIICERRDPPISLFANIAKRRRQKWAIKTRRKVVALYYVPGSKGSWRVEKRKNVLRRGKGLSTHTKVNAPSSRGIGMTRSRIIIVTPAKRLVLRNRRVEWRGHQVGGHNKCSQFTRPEIHLSPGQT